MYIQSHITVILQTYFLLAFYKYVSITNSSLGEWPYSRILLRNRCYDLRTILRPSRQWRTQKKLKNSARSKTTRGLDDADSEGDGDGDDDDNDEP